MVKLTSSSRAVALLLWGCLSTDLHCSCVRIYLYIYVHIDVDLAPSCAGCIACFSILCVVKPEIRGVHRIDSWEGDDNGDDDEYDQV